MSNIPKTTLAESGQLSWAERNDGWEHVDTSDRRIRARVSAFHGPMIGVEGTGHEFWAYLGDAGAASLVTYLLSQTAPTDPQQASSDSVKRLAAEIALLRTDSPRGDLLSIAQQAGAYAVQLIAERDASMRTLDEHRCDDQAERAYRRALSAEEQRDQVSASMAQARTMVATLASQLWSTTPGANRTKEILREFDSFTAPHISALRDSAQQANALRAAADAIQALHPGEVKASVVFLRERADGIHPVIAGGNIITIDGGTRCLRECTTCGERVTVSHATSEWESEHTHNG